MRGLSRFLPSVVLAAALTTGALPARAAECKPLSRVVSLDITSLPGGRPGVPVLIGNSPELFAVETGFIFSSVTPSTVQKYKLSVRRTTRFLTGLRGPDFHFLKSDREVRLPSMTIGNLQTMNPLLMVWPPTEATEQPIGWAGSLAEDLLAGFDADFDFGAGKLNLMSSDHCPGQVVYWQAPSVAVVPLRIDTSANLWFPVMLDGKPLEAWLNTGAPTSSMKLIDAQLLFNLAPNAPDTEHIRDVSGTSSFAVYRHRFKTLSVQGVTLTDPQLLLLPDVVQVSGAPEAPTLNLGMTILRQMHIYIAYKERKLYISANSAPTQ